MLHGHVVGFASYDVWSLMEMQLRRPHRHQRRLRPLVHLKRMTWEEWEECRLDDEIQEPLEVLLLQVDGPIRLVE
jgi:hypothetical protein